MNYEKLLNPVVMETPPSGIRKYFDIAATMDDVISLSVGEPDFPTPYPILQAGIEALERGKTKYTSNRGTEELRCEISKYLKNHFGISYDPDDEILISVGGSEAIDIAVRAIVSEGDEVIIPQPSYVCYGPITSFAGGVPVIIETKEENNFKITPEELKAAITDKTKAIILPYPCNPTGAIMEKKDLEALADVLRDTDIFVISDEVYSELTYETERATIANIPGMHERTVYINGFSKEFSMTGWRMGYACAPREIMVQMTKIHQFAIMCAPTVSQYAALTALRDCQENVDQMIGEYNHRRKIMVEGFNQIGLECHEPKGAFYAFPSIKSTGLSSEEFCDRLLAEKHVAVVPGTAFGECGEGFIRVSYCYSNSHIREGIKRIGEFLKELENEKK